MHRQRRRLPAAHVHASLSPADVAALVAQVSSGMEIVPLRRLLRDCAFHPVVVDALLARLEIEAIVRGFDGWAFDAFRYLTDKQLVPAHAPVLRVLRVLVAHLGDHVHTYTRWNAAATALLASPHCTAEDLSAMLAQASRHMQHGMLARIADHSAATPAIWNQMMTVQGSFHMPRLLALAARPKRHRPLADALMPELLRSPMPDAKPILAVLPCVSPEVRTSTINTIAHQFPGTVVNIVKAEGTSLFAGLDPSVFGYFLTASSREIREVGLLLVGVSNDDLAGQHAVVAASPAGPAGSHDADLEAVYGPLIEPLPPLPLAAQDETGPPAVSAATTASPTASPTTRRRRIP